MRILGVISLALGASCGAEAVPVQEPCAREDAASELYAEGHPMEAAAIYFELLSDDPMTLHNYAAVLHDAGMDAEPLFETVLASACPDAPFVPWDLLALADYAIERGDYEHAARLRAQAEDLFEEP